MVESSPCDLVSHCYRHCELALTAGVATHAFQPGWRIPDLSDSGVRVRGTSNGSQEERARGDLLPGQRFVEHQDAAEDTDHRGRERRVDDTATGTRRTSRFRAGSRT